MPALLQAQTPGATPPPRMRDVMIPQPFPSAVDSAYSTSEQTSNAYSPWFNVSDDLLPPDGFDPVVAAEDALSDQADAVAETSMFQPAALPLMDLPMDDIGGLTAGTSPAFLGEAQEISLPYGLSSWPTSSAPRELVADYKRQRDLTHVGFLRVGLDIKQSVGLFYNVFGTPNNPKNDIVAVTRPYLYIEAGTKGNLQILYTPEITKYSRYSQLDTSNQQAALRIRYPFTKLNIAADAFYISQNSLFLQNPDAGRADLTGLLGRASAEYPWTEKLSSRLSGEAFHQTSSPGGTQTDQSVSIQSNFQFTPTLMAGGSLTGGAFSSPAGDQTYTTVKAMGSYNPSRAVHMALEAGMQVRRFDFPVTIDNPLPIPVFSFSLDWFPSSTASFSFRLYRTVMNTSFTDVSISITTAATTSMLLHIYEKVNVQLEMGVGHSEMLSDSSEGDDNFNFAIGAFRASYPLYRWLEVEIFDNFQQRLDDSEGNNYMSNIAGVAFTVKF